MREERKPSDRRAGEYPGSSGPSLAASGPSGTLHTHSMETCIRRPEGRSDAGNTRASEDARANLGHKLEGPSKVCAGRLVVFLESGVQERAIGEIMVYNSTSLVQSGRSDSVACGWEADDQQSCNHWQGTLIVLAVPTWRCYIEELGCAVAFLLEPYAMIAGRACSTPRSGCRKL